MGYITLVLFIVGSALKGSGAVTVTTTQLQLKHLEVYTLEHLHQVSGSPSGSGEYIRDTLLVLYNPTCRAEAHALPLLDHSLPSMPLLATLLYDWEQFPARVWYQQEDAERLEKRFPPRGCPSVLFIPQGQGGAEDFRYWEEGRDGGLLEWVWAMMERNVTITNTCDRPITVLTAHEHAHDNKTAEVPAGGTITQALHKTDRVLVTEIPGSHNYFRSLVVEEDVSMRVECRFHVEGAPLSAPAGLYAECQELSGRPNVYHFLSCAVFVEQQAYVTLYSVSGHVLRALKHPLVVPSLHARGYHKMTVPAVIYRKLRAVYAAERPRRRLENIHVSHLMNYDHVNTYLVPLPEMVKRHLAELLQPVMEGFCNCSLTPTVTYGVREYHAGCRLYPHVDSINTHVISAIVHVHKELGDNPDWPLEVIDLSGVRRQVYLEPGEMLLYESTKMIHGRPQPFRGHLYANAFFHYRPMGWEQQFGRELEGESWVKHRGGTEDMFPLESPLTDLLLSGEPWPAAEPFQQTLLPPHDEL